MKNKRKIFFLFIFFISFIAISHATDPPPLDTGGPGGDATPLGGSAPIGSGYIISILLALTYGGLKFLKNNIQLKLLNHEK